MQLVAYGAQDIYLTGNPQITFFKVVYRRHTNFSVEPIELAFDGSVGAGKKVSVTIARHGDLVHRMWIEAKVTSAAAAESLSLIKSVEVEIGGQKIDKHYYRFMHGYARSFGSTEEIGTLATLTRTIAATETTVMIPLMFWFNRNAGLALPLVALQYHEVKLNIEFASNILTSAAVGGAAPTTFSVASLWVDYVYLDTDERRRFAQTSHEYLIEQVQTSTESINSSSKTNEVTTNVDLDFNHPCKYILFYLGNPEDTVTVASGASLDAAQDIYLTSAKLQLNGHDRLADRHGDYYGTFQFYEAGLGNTLHTNQSVQELATVTNGGLNNLEGLDAALATGGTSGAKYYMYSFALKPQEHQPSGTCNFSRIDNARLLLKHKATSSSAATASTLHLYGVNYNVLRVMSGMAGLAYSN